ncbi:hypothetical protein M427DRAFT_43596 [Gonapodya prolifera JEL478]|uniref:SH3 domain-containing protein n=1 Tax=Gonapodya prolifera (strain JEL478) TaxID=1344416 RepID=A0A139AIB4_GONPJ|nr:hypothetical protein M427DRAFT_43596 [Gonapodya prolifera JEL478]|eukprot:KXS16527.1 hypothetical protein M427DRAFT_43596 [Gonapodya prolifera JEL478]
MADSSLIDAIEAGSLSALQKALAQGANPNARKTVRLSIMFKTGSRKTGQVFVRKELVKKKLFGKSEYRDVYEDTFEDVMESRAETLPMESALSIAIRIGNADIVSALLNAGANPNASITWRIPLSLPSWSLKDWPNRFNQSFAFDTALDLLTYSGSTLSFNAKGAQVQHENPASQDQVRIVWNTPSKPNSEIVSKLLKFGATISDGALKSVVSASAVQCFESMVAVTGGQRILSLVEAGLLDGLKVARIGLEMTQPPSWILEAALMVQKPNVDVIRGLVSHSTPVSDSALRLACNTNKLECFKALVDAVAGVLDAETVISLGLEFGTLDLVEYLLQCGFPPSPRKLEAALDAKYPRLDVATLLLEHGAIPSEAAFLAALKLRDNEYVELLLHYGGSYPSALEYALMLEGTGLDAAKLLLEQGVPPSGLAITLAMECGMLDELLEKHHAVPNSSHLMRELRRETPVIETINKLMASSAVPTDQHLQYALDRPSPRVEDITLLLENGVSPSKTAFETALARGANLIIIKQLLEHGAVVSNTALRNIKATGNSELVQAVDTALRERARVRRGPLKKAIVEYAVHAYAPREPDEIALGVGDPVVCHTRFADGWCQGINRTTSAFGIFPGICLSATQDDVGRTPTQAIPNPRASSIAMSTTLSTTAIAPYAAEETDELTLTIGDRILCVATFADGWGYGNNVQTSRHGFFPLICVQVEQGASGTLSGSLVLSGRRPLPSAPPESSFRVEIAPSTVMFGVCYEYGKGVEKDERQAVMCKKDDRNIHGDTAINVASEKAHWGIVPLLAASGASTTKRCLRMAIWRQEIAHVELVLDFTPSDVLISWEADEPQAYFLL